METTKKKIVKIFRDYNSDICYDMFCDEVKMILEESKGKLFCEVSNNKFENIVQKYNPNKNKDGLNNKTKVTANGYSQEEWQEYTIYYSDDFSLKDLEQLCNELKKSFTHFNDFTCHDYEEIEVDGNKFRSEILDVGSLQIRHIEFPDRSEVIECYNYIYGREYDEIEVDEN